MFSVYIFHCPPSTTWVLWNIMCAYCYAVYNIKSYLFYCWLRCQCTSEVAFHLNENPDVKTSISYRNNPGCHISSHVTANYESIWNWRCPFSKYIEWHSTERTNQIRSVIIMNWCFIVWQYLSFCQRRQISLRVKEMKGGRRSNDKLSWIYSICFLRRFFYC